MSLKDEKNRKEYQDKYNKKHYINNKKYYRIKALKARLKLRKQYQDFKNNKPCFDCGVKYPYYVLDYDHRNPTTKFMEISKIVMRYGMRRMLEEIKKCDLVCSNCHRERTHRRLQKEKENEN